MCVPTSILFVSLFLPVTASSELLRTCYETVTGRETDTGDRCREKHITTGRHIDRVDSKDAQTHRQTDRRRRQRGRNREKQIVSQLRMFR